METSLRPMAATALLFSYIFVIVHNIQVSVIIKIVQIYNCGNLSMAINGFYRAKFNFALRNICSTFCHTFLGLFYHKSCA